LKDYLEVNGKKHYFCHTVSGLWSAVLFAREKDIPLSELKTITRTGRMDKAIKINLPETISPEKEQIYE